jgi:hypothetical protein
VDATELTRDRSMLLGGVRRGPRIDDDAAGTRTMIGLQTHLNDRGIVAQPTQRLDGRSTEREHVRRLVSRDNDRRAAERRNQPLGGERPVLVVVDENLVERARAGGRRLRRPNEQAGEVQDAQPAELVLIALGEARELVPPA